MSTVTIGSGVSNAYIQTGDLTGNLSFIMASGIANVATAGAVVVPVGTTAQRPASPVNGMVRFNTTIPCLEGYANNVWVGFI
jgi:hypothetical protein